MNFLTPLCVCKMSVSFCLYLKTDSGAPMNGLGSQQGFALEQTFMGVGVEITLQPKEETMQTRGQQPPEGSSRL